ncbi:MAG TPA: glycerate kinase [Tepidisphaeraceae bacterium]|jgi:glycerate kinase|nr:glycerate kinase [Tepidisphaeraceae bacterium]
MKILIAPDKFKGSLSAIEAADAIAAGIRRVWPDAVLDLCPVADGGEGTVSALVAATGGSIQVRRVTGPLPEMKVDAAFGLLGDGQTAVIEMAAASGLALLRPDQRDPLATTTFGTGELLDAAAILGVRHVLLGIGGSATVDAGIGCAQACGLPIILEAGEPVAMTEPLCGRDIDRVVLVKHGRGEAIEGVRITVACDVNNPLYGPTGAAPVFAPQKGASPQVVRQLDESLRRLALRVGKDDIAHYPGAGAAGGLGFGMMAFFRAELRSGIDIVLDAVRLSDRLTDCDLCITGEGSLDAQSLHGKAPAGVAALCMQKGIPCIALAGRLGSDLADLKSHGILAAYALADGSRPVEECVANAKPLLCELAERVARGYRLRP